MVQFLYKFCYCLKKHTNISQINYKSYQTPLTNPPPPGGGSYTKTISTTDKFTTTEKNTFMYCKLIVVRIEGRLFLIAR